MRAVLDDVGDDKLEDVDVALHQVETALALLLTGPGSHHHHPGVGCHTVVWHSDKKSVLMQPQNDSYSIGRSVFSTFFSRQRLSSFFLRIHTFVGHNLVCLEEEGSVLQVHDLTLQLVLHHINQGQLITQVLIIYIK